MVANKIDIRTYELYTDLLKKVLTRVPMIDDPAARLNRTKGLDWPGDAETMIGIERLSNIQNLIEKIYIEDVQGDVAECGVWKGGATIFMRGVLKALELPRVVWVADSFKGCPPPDVANYPADKGDLHSTYKFLGVSEDEVIRNFERWGMLDDQVRFVPGFFKDSLPGPIGPLALLRSDCDMYESTTQVLEALYSHVSHRGYVIVDDYHSIEGTRKAVDDFRLIHGVDDTLIQVDGFAAYWCVTRRG